MKKKLMKKNNRILETITIKKQLIKHVKITWTNRSDGSTVEGVVISVITNGRKRSTRFNCFVVLKRLGRYLRGKKIGEVGLRWLVDVELLWLVDVELLRVVLLVKYWSGFGLVSTVVVLRFIVRLRYVLA